MTVRSMPVAMPPSGGAPYSSASSNAPNRTAASSFEMPRTSNARSCIARLKMRMLPAELVPVDHEVVLGRDRFSRIGFEELRVVRRERTRKRVVGESPRPLGCALEHRKAVDPHHVVCRRIHQPELLTELPPDLSDRPTRDAVFIRDYEPYVA